MNAFRRSPFVIASVVALIAPAFVFAQTANKVPGEKWKQTVTMEMQGMKIPSRTVEVCVPVGKAEEALARPPDNQNCQMSNVKKAGNSFAADLKCTGTPPVEGHIESTTEGNRTVGKMQMNMQGMAMTMNFDSTKLGTSCEAVDYAAVAARAQAAAPQIQAPDVCGQFADRFSKEPGEAVNASHLYTEKSGQCATHASKKTFCSAVQTHAGFLGLSNQERAMASVGTERNAMTAPLTASLQSCNLGTAAALRTRLLGTAEKQNEWDFLVAEGDDATFQMLTATAKRECSGRSFTNAAPGRYASLCRKYGVALARGDREAALSAAGVSGTTASAGPGAGATAAAPAPSAAASGSASSEAEPAEEAQKSKAREALDKSRRKLKGLFGGGGD